MSDDLHDSADNIVGLDAARARRKSQLNEIDQAKIAAMRAESQTALEDLVDRFNAQYAVVNESGKVWVFRWRHDPAMNRDVLERIGFSDFQHMHENRRLSVLLPEDPNTKTCKEKEKSLAEWWLTHPRRRGYLGGVTFDPLGQAPADYWNLWKGPAVKPKPGDWSLMRNHIETVLCSGVREHSEYVLDWLARMVQQPNKPGETALVFRGDKGCGKGIFGRWVVALYGQHGMQLIHPSQLVGRFNEHLRDCIALFADEAFYAGDKQHESVLKGLITEPFIAVEGKGLRIVVVPNMLHLILASNSDWVIPASSDERRYAMFDVPDSRVGDLPYFAAIDRQMREGGLAAMLHDLLARDISGFEVRAVPQTKALGTQKLLSLGSLDRWWLAVLERGFVWRSQHGVGEFGEWHTFCTTELLDGSYQQWCDENRERSRNNRVELGIWLTKMYPPARPRPPRIIGEVKVRPPLSSGESLVVRATHKPGYSVGALQAARAKFTEKHKVAGNWGQVTDDAGNPVPDDEDPSGRGA